MDASWNVSVASCFRALVLKPFGGLHYSLNLLAAVGSSFVYNLNGDVAALVQTVNHLL